MSHDLLTLDPRPLRGTDSNSLLGLDDLANALRNTSPLQLEREQAEKVIRRIAKEQRKRDVPL